MSTTQTKSRTESTRTSSRDKSFYKTPISFYIMMGGIAFGFILLVVVLLLA